MWRSCCFASFVGTTGGAETSLKKLQWQPLARKLPVRRRTWAGCAASDNSSSDAGKAGAAAADAVFRRLDASLDDEDDEDLYFEQELFDRGVRNPPLTGDEAQEVHINPGSNRHHQTSPSSQNRSGMPRTTGPRPSDEQRVDFWSGARGRGRGRGRGGSRAEGAPSTRSRNRGGKVGGHGNNSSGNGHELRGLLESVRGAAANGSWEDALTLVAGARSSGLRLDGRVHTAALRAALGGGAPRSVLSAISDMRADGFVPNISLYNKAISLCGRKGMWKEAVSLLRDAQQLSSSKGSKGKGQGQHRGPDVVTYSAAVAACRNGGQWQQALSLMEEMQAAGIQPDQIAFGTAVSACAIGGQWRRAVSLLADMRRVNLLPDVVAYSSAIKACAAEGRWEEALGLLKQMQEVGVRPNLITYTGAMEACGRAGQWSKTLGLLAQIRDRGLQPDAVTLNAVMDSLGRAGETEKALALLSTMRPARRPHQSESSSSETSARRSRWPPSANRTPRRAPFSASSADAVGPNNSERRRSRSGGGGGAAEATGAQDSMRGEGPQADVFTWSAAMTACIEGGQWQRVDAMLKEMKDDGIQPNVINYNLAVRALGRGGDWERATGLLEEMKEAGVDPDDRTFNAAIEACGRGGRWERAVSLLDDMRRQGLDPDGLTYSTVIAACDRGGAWDICLWMLEEAREERVEGIDANANVTAKANVFAYTAAISACGKAGHWEEAVSLLDVMREDGVPPNQVTLRAALVALENAPTATPPLDTRRETTTIPGENPNPPASLRTHPFLPNASGGSPSSQEIRGRGRSSPALPWEVALSLVERMAGGNVEGQDGVRVFPGPRDFSAALTAACFGGAEWASIVQILDLMHSCATSDASSMRDAGAAGGGGTHEEAAAAATVSSRGNEEWGPADGCEGLVQAYNHVIRICGDAGGTELALGLLDEMHRRGLAPDAVSYAGAIIACDLAGMWREAVTLLDDMREKAGIEPDLVCYNCAVKACGSSGEYAQALRVLDTMRARGVAPDEITYSSAIAACGNSGEARRAMALLQAMKAEGVPAGLIAHNAAIGACNKGGEWSLAVSALKDMREAGIRPDAISYAGALSSCDRAGEWRLTLELYDQMRADMAVDSASAATDADVSAIAHKSGETIENIRTADELAGSRAALPPPRATLAALTACARGGQWQKAVSILRELQGTGPGRLGKRPGRGDGSVGGDGGGGLDRIRAHFGRSSSLAFNAALVACAKGAEIEAKSGRDCRAVQEAALEILGMEPSPDLTGYGLAITACGFAGNVEGCVGLLGEMLRGGMTPTLADYHNSLRACATRRRADVAQEILESLASEGVEPDARCYRLAADAFRKSETETIELSSEAKRLLDMAEHLESGEVGEVPRDCGGSGTGDIGSPGGSGRVDLADVLDSLGVSGTAELRALLDGAEEVEFDSLEAR